MKESKTNETLEIKQKEREVFQKLPALSPEQ